MDNRNKIKELFEDLATEELFSAWGDTFDVEESDGSRVVVVYHGDRDVKEFKKECRGTLEYCIYSVYGELKKLKIVKQLGPSLSPRTKKNIKAVKFFVIGMIFVCIATAIIVILCNYIGNRDFRETFYNTSSIKIDSTVRVIQLSDLHNTSYGKNNERLLGRIEALEPDVIICTGDIVDSAQNDIEDVLSLAESLAKIAPSYYVYGNREVESIYGFFLSEEELDEKFGFTPETRDPTALLSLEDTFEEKLEEVGIKVLKNEMDSINIDAMTIDVYGILNSNPSSFWSYSEEAFFDYLYENPDHIKITAVHEPFIFEQFPTTFWGDLMLCGHTHGGVIRVPVLGPLYTREAGIFPEREGSFVCGKYSLAGKPLFVSAGLENTNVLRINNEPELVIIDINKF